MHGQQVSTIKSGQGISVPLQSMSVHPCKDCEDGMSSANIGVMFITALTTCLLENITFK